MQKLSKIHSVVTVGLEPELVEVEVDVGAGIPSLSVVGLPDKAVEESKERVRAAIKNSGFDFPQKKVVINLAPADVKKEGPVYDLPIAIGVIVAGGLISPEAVKNIIFLGELSLGGEIRQAKGVIQAAILARKLGSPLVVPKPNEVEASLISNIDLCPAENLKTLISDLVLKNRQIFTETKKQNVADCADYGEFDFKNIVGQHQAKRALEIASAGGHNALLSGPPGGGKTLLSRSIVSILPALDEEEILEVTKIYSVAGLLTNAQPVIFERPFRSPHHTTSSVAVIGGGTYPKPGEVSLAHKGVLFLDEFPEFPRSVLEALRQPLEDHFVTVSRAQGTLHFPANFILVAAKNPCPCGFLGDEKRECNCAPNQIISYNKKISGPLLDRIDLQIQVGKIPLREIASKIEEELSSGIRKRVTAARKIQKQRSQKLFGKMVLNNELKKSHIEKVVNLPEDLKRFIEDAVEKLDFSMRGYLKILKVARTIADLESTAEISQAHLAEALQYRTKEKEDAI